MAQPSSIFVYMKEAARHIVRMRDVKFEPSLFQNYLTGTALDELLCSYKGLPKGVNYMVIGDPGVGKTTIIMDMLSDIRMISTSARVLFISAEMNEIDLAVYVQRFPKFKDLDILFIKADFSSEGGNVHCLDILTEVFDSGWDVVAIDSFYELQGIIKEEENITLKRAESLLLALLKEQNEGHNDISVNTTFLIIQQVTKNGNFIGSNRLKHYITAMMELRLENPKNVYSSRNEIPEISTIIDGEDFLTNSIYLKWNPGGIELGHYYERLICSNGQVERVSSRDAMINSLATEQVNKMLALPGSKIMNRGFHKFRNAAIQAMNTRASMQELKYVSTFLEKFGLDAHKVEEVAPYRKELQEYTARGYDIDRNNAATNLASMTVWNLYNSVTAFASHNDIWPEEDGRRMAVCETAVKFLYHDRDIKNYIDIFA